MESYDKRQRKLIETILDHLPRQVAPDSEDLDVRQFVRRYFKHVPVTDLMHMNPKEACMRALSAWEFLQRQEREGSKLRVFYPTAKTHGWDSDRAIVQMLNTDMPFLVDSTMSELKRQGYDIFSTIHPIVRVKRDKNGQLVKFDTRGTSVASKGEYLVESLIDYEISAPGDEKDAAALERDLENTLSAVRACVRDWKAMVSKVDDTIGTLKDIPADVPIDELAEVIDFLRWLRDDHFVLLGYVEYDFRGEGGAFHEVEGAALGLFTLPEFRARSKGIAGLPPEVRHFLLKPELVEITKAQRRSMVHRPVHMDYVAIKRFDRRGEVVGERRLLGLFTSSVYFSSVRQIPILRRKEAYVLEQSGFAPTTHDHKALVTILEFLPRDELFQMHEEDLFELAMGVLSLEMRPRAKMFARKDLLERFVSCLVYVPRTRFSTELRYKVQKVLEETYNGTVTAYYTQITDSPLARMHLIVKTTPGQIPDVKLDEVNDRIAEAVSAWEDMLREALRQQYGESHGDKMFRIYGRAFTEMYTRRYAIADALKDIESMEKALRSGSIALDLFYHPEDPEGQFRLKVYHPKQQVTLSEVLPVLENMGVEVVEENPSLARPMGHKEGVWIRDFHLQSSYPVRANLKQIKPLFEEALEKVWAGELENDRFNRLVIAARLSWRQVVVFRAYAKYLKQIRFSYDQEAIEQTLAAYPEMVALLFDLFDLRFNPARKDNSDKAQQKITQALDEALAKISNVTHDRILRRYSDVIRASLRTNYYQLDENGKPKPYVSFKLNPSAVPYMPKPVPHAEIFVYSRRVEGVHLRGGKVARGGLRWSDRHEDFRTEVLGLMKAQMVKNAVIVPVGSKGGFVVKQPPQSGDRQDMLNEGIACYKIYLSGLLDITDNIVKGKVKPPEAVVRHDEDDPYLVVAADKGTATFSDIANGVSKDYGFWLGDAFASGGSAGYDHKKMGITAKGGWISVRRHFREMGKDIQKEDVTVVGIGDMSGDVFGNGMLLSKHICLVGAFNHLHVFVDPAPDAAASFKERQRLFKLPRSTWDDYDKSLISKGGGVFRRDAKSVRITREMKKLFDIQQDELTPDELIRAMLTAPVEMIWNGGIGTYVKSSLESNDTVGDRTNDGLRVNGRELRCKVVGEGGNLGFTQRGRVEYALAGGRLNTDAIDNSAGVDCSDHEVNIKIAFSKALERGTLTVQQRDTLLEAMTGEVEKLVLRDNTLQTQALTIAQTQGAANLEAQLRVMKALEKTGLLSRAIEFLPTDEEIDARMAAGQGLARPELAVLLAYSKIELYNDLLDSQVPDDAYFENDLIRYFPEKMQKDFVKEIKEHQLRREIIATVVTNSIINRIGSTFFFQVKEDTGVHPCDIARAYVVARDAFQLRDIWEQIEALDGKVAVGTQAQMFHEINQFIYRCTLWFLRNFPQPLKVGEIITKYADQVREVVRMIPSMLRGDSKEAFESRYANLVAEGVSKDLAEKIAMVIFMGAACDIVKVAITGKRSLVVAGKVYFELGAALRLGWLRNSAESLGQGGFWSRQAVTAIVSDLYEQQSRLTSEVMKVGCDAESCDSAIGAWRQKYARDVERHLHFIDDLATTQGIDYPQLVVALRKVEMLSTV